MAARAARLDEIARGPGLRPQRQASRELEDGALVEVRDASERFVGHALYNSASDIRLRWLSRGRRNALDRPRTSCRRACARRTTCARTLRLEEATNAYRVCHAEGDDLSGLIVDRLGDVLVCELHALGFLRLLPRSRTARTPLSGLRARGARS
jgi:23S rRNA (cytosine1962-C5)-methyltransferase